MQFKRGMTREVFLIGKWAFKFPSVRSGKLFLSGMLANMQEREFSRTGWIELCPVIFYVPMGLLVVMPRCEPLTDIQWKHFDHRRFATRGDHYAQCNYDNIKGQVHHPYAEPEGMVIPVENKRCSFGVYKCRFVAVDYGN